MTNTLYIFHNQLYNKKNDNLLVRKISHSDQINQLTNQYNYAIDKYLQLKCAQKENVI